MKPILSGEILQRNDDLEEAIPMGKFMEKKKTWPS